MWNVLPGRLSTYRIHWDRVLRIRNVVTLGLVDLSPLKRYRSVEGITGDFVADTQYKLTFRDTDTLVFIRLGTSYERISFDEPISWADNQAPYLGSMSH